MNTEIKFRYVFKTFLERVFVEYFYLTEVEAGKLNDYMQGWHDVKIIQKNIFSGVNDKNAVPIYDGDILRMNWLEEVVDELALNVVESKHAAGNQYHSWNEYFDAKDACKKLVIVERILPIVFEEGNFWCVREDNQRLYFYHKIKEWDVEVIGNIYENPSLLNQ